MFTDTEEGRSLSNAVAQHEGFTVEETEVAEDFTLANSSILASGTVCGDQDNLIFSLSCRLRPLNNHPLEVTYV